MKKRILFLVFPSSTLLDLAGPLQVFQEADKCLDDASGYDSRLVSPDGGTINTDTVLPVVTEAADALDIDQSDTLIVVGGNLAHVISEQPETGALVRRLAEKCGRVASVCTGSFFLASAGLLSRRRAVTHWRACDLFADRFPDVFLERDPIFLRDGGVWTSAGVTAGIDMALAMVSQDWGRATALETAREMVTYMARPGGQMQFSTVLESQFRDTAGVFDDLQCWIRDNLGADLSVDALAAEMSMTPRTFARRFGAVFGQSPAKYVELVRLETAMSLLAGSTLPIKVVAVRCGFVDDEKMRRAFQRHLGVAPRDYRDRFAAEQPETV